MTLCGGTLKRCTAFDTRSSYTRTGLTKAASSAFSENRFGIIVSGRVAHGVARRCTWLQCLEVAITLPMIIASRYFTCPRGEPLPMAAASKQFCPGCEAPSVRRAVWKCRQTRSFRPVSWRVVTILFRPYPGGPGFKSRGRTTNSRIHGHARWAMAGWESSNTLRRAPSCLVNTMVGVTARLVSVAVKDHDLDDHVNR